MGPRVLYGYRFGEVPQDDLPRVRDDTMIEVKIYPNPEMRRPVAVDLGVSVVGLCMPHPDLSHGPTVAAGLAKRVCGKLPDPNFPLLEYARLWTIKKVKDLYPDPISPDADTTPGTWLAGSSYSFARRCELAAVTSFLPGCLPKEAYLFKSFVKAEFYPEWKQARSIQGPTDELKVHFGPVLALCEKIIFAGPQFIKKVPVAERPTYIASLFQDGARVAASDFSSFEVSWQRAQMDAFELPVLDHLTSLLPHGAEFMRELRLVETGKIKLVFKHVIAYIHATRKSGTMNTSMSNGFGNWIIHEFASDYLKLGRLNGVFEGDDGLFNYSGGNFPTPDFYQQLGFAVKLEIHPSIAEASFCGMIFDPVECIAIVDPIKTLTKLGWGAACYTRARTSTKKSLLRCKAMSMAAQNPRCPVIAACADWILRCTAGLDTRRVLESRNTSWWDRQSFLSGIRTVDRRPCGPATRSLMDQKFGVSVPTQLAMEEWFDQQKSLCPIPAWWSNPLWATVDLDYTRVLTAPILDDRPVFPDQPLAYPLVQDELGETRIRWMTTKKPLSPKDGACTAMQ